MRRRWRRALLAPGRALGTMNVSSQTRNPAHSAYARYCVRRLAPPDHCVSTRGARLHAASTMRVALQRKHDVSDLRRGELGGRDRERVNGAGRDDCGRAVHRRRWCRMVLGVAAPADDAPGARPKRARSVRTGASLGPITRWTHSGPRLGAPSAKILPLRGYSDLATALWPRRSGFKSPRSPQRISAFPGRWVPRALEARAVVLAAHHGHPMRLLEGEPLPSRSERHCTRLLPGRRFRASRRCTSAVFPRSPQRNGFRNTRSAKWVMDSPLRDSRQAPAHSQPLVIAPIAARKGSERHLQQANAWEGDRPRARPKTQGCAVGRTVGGIEKCGSDNRLSRRVWLWL